MVKLLHIGLGKCGSTFLQTQIFPKIEQKLNTNYINLTKNSLIKANELKLNTHLFKNLKNFKDLLPNNFIISNESLFSKGWEFSRIEQSFRHIKNNFSNDTIILIIIRNPYDLLNSIYCQSIHEMRIVKPENFFYIDDKEAKIRQSNKFNLHNFDYSKLIFLYKSHFKKVIVVKYENLKELQFLKEIFDIDNEFINKLKKNKNISYNKSISKYGINFILLLNKLFNVKAYQLYILNLIKPSNSLIVKVKNRLLLLFSLRYFFQSIFDKIIPYKKYYIKRKFIPIDIEKEISKYNKLDI